ncbi:MAG: hypothetical protein ACREC5_02930 [Thermoplasmata archaeon]
MDEVTSKVAYAYAKLQAGVVGAVALIAVAPEIAALQGSLPLSILLGLCAVGPGAALLWIAANTTDLERTGYAAKRCFPVAGLLWIVILGLAEFQSPLRSGSAQIAELGAFFIAALAIVSYPLPVRRGSVVLYRPAAIRALSDRRATLLGLGLLVGLAAIELLPGGISSGADLSVRVSVAGALAAALGGVGLTLAGGVHRAVRPGGEVLLLASGFLLVLSAGLSGWDRTSLLLASGPAAVAVMTVVVLHVVSPELNHGRKIISRRG